MEDKKKRPKEKTPIPTSSLSSLSRSQLEAVLDASPLGVSISRYYDGEIIYVNETLANWRSDTAENMLGTNSILYYRDHDDIAWVISELRNKRPVTNHEMEMNRADGTIQWCEVNMIALWVEDQRMILTWFSNIDELRQAREEVRLMATTDALTGLSNRHTFSEGLNTAYRDSIASGTSIAMLYLDLDGFKYVNDNYGHVIGDSILEQVGHSIKSAAPSELCARLGGDEFAVLCTQDKPLERAIIIAQQLLAALSQPFKMDVGEVLIGVSIGIAESGDKSEADSLIRNADHAMYQAKAEGKHRFKLFAE